MLNNQNFFLVDLFATKKLAAAIAAAVEFPQIILLEGGFGVGKTSFVKFFAYSLGINELVTSPSFTLMHQFKFNGDRLFSHFDGYKIKDRKNTFWVIEHLADDIVIIEWPKPFLPHIELNQALLIEFIVKGETSRTAVVTGQKKLVDKITNIFNKK